MNILTYLKEAKAELAHVTWPTRDEAQFLTGVVLGGSLIVGFYIGGLDFSFTKLMGVLLK